jgi:hypothetical protein
MQCTEIAYVIDDSSVGIPDRGCLRHLDHRGIRTEGKHAVVNLVRLVRWFLGLQGDVRTRWPIAVAWL